MWALLGTIWHSFWLSLAAILALIALISGILAILEKFPAVIMGSYHGFLKFKLWRTARLVLAFMKSKHPSVYYDAIEIIQGLKLKKRQTWDALEKLETENRVHRHSADEALGGVLWELDELER
jgi:hypothetical protein